MENRRDEAWEQHLEWSLRAIDGGEAAPDVTARVEALVSRRTAASRRAPGGRRVGWAAAAVMLAITTVVGVRLLSAPSDGAAPRQDPVHHVVGDVEDVRSLPADARWVTVLRHGDDVIEQVVERCPRLERLHVNCMGDLQRQPTNRVFSIVAALTELRELFLLKAVRVDGRGVEGLLALPRLEVLVLAWANLDDAFFPVLPRMPSLRTLDLSYCRGVDEEAMRHIARCPGLRQLGIPGCKDVTAEALAELAKLTPLEGLEARQLECSFDGFAIEELERLTFADFADAQFSPDWLRRLPTSLRKLSLSQTALQDAGCGALAERLSALRELGVGGTDVSDAGVAVLARLPELRMLGLSNCSAVTSASVEVLERHPRLAKVELPREPWATPESLRPLFERGIDVRMHAPALDHALEPLRRRYAEALAERANQDSGGAK